ncbi:MAG TPA: chemotaxis protein CheA [Fimbriimonadaceae bacterium]|nr:chemotaxis protein CheA [Fimbriimonadaceae bacterium]
MNAESASNEFLGIYLQEADEQIQIVEGRLSQPELSESDIHEIFRACHTLKGNSRAMEFHNVAQLSHAMEDLLDEVRSGKIAWRSEVAQVLLAGVDALSEGMSLIRSSGSERELITTVPKQIKELLNGRITRPDSSANHWSGELVLDAGVDLKFAKALIAIRVVESNGTLLKTLPTLPEIENEDFGDRIQIEFSSGETDKIAEEISKIAGVVSFEIGPLKETAKPATVPTSQIIDKPTIRVDVNRLDNLMNLVGELVTDRTRLQQSKGQVHAGIHETVDHLERITSDLQDEIMKARLQPLQTVFSRVPRAVRDIAQSLGKEIDLQIMGGETEVDRSVLEVLPDPILHLLRNSIDHGIEDPAERIRLGKSVKGKVTLSAKHQGEQILIAIQDDGRGIDVDRVRTKALELKLVTPAVAQSAPEKECLTWIFEPGFSTASEVSQVSGRGVGMDVVRSNLTKIGGSVDVESFAGKGTRFTLRLPLTLAIIRGLIVGVSDRTVAIPIGSIQETVRITQPDAQTVFGAPAILLRDTPLPLQFLSSPLEIAEQHNEMLSQSQYVVIVQGQNGKVGLVVDKLFGEREIVVKPLSPYCGKPKGFSGATILGDGTVALIADVAGLADLGGN